MEKDTGESINTDAEPFNVNHFNPNHFIKEQQVNHITAKARKKSEGWLDKLEHEICYMHDPTTMDAEQIQTTIDSKYTLAD